MILYKDYYIILIKMKYKDFLEEYYDDLNDMYYSVMNFVNIKNNKKNIMDKLTKEDFFYFIFENSE